jgi:hypothetical protein
VNGCKVPGLHPQVDQKAGSTSGRSIPLPCQRFSAGPEAPALWEPLRGCMNGGKLVIGRLDGDPRKIWGRCCPLPASNTILTVTGKHPGRRTPKPRPARQPSTNVGGGLSPQTRIMISCLFGEPVAAFAVMQCNDQMANGADQHRRSVPWTPSNGGGQCRRNDGTKSIIDASPDDTKHVTIRTVMKGPILWRP